MLRAAIFDVDGTLVDSVDLHAQAWQDAFRKFGHEIGFEEIRGQIGKGGDQLLPVFLSTADLEAQGKDLDLYRSQVFKERYLSKVRGFPKVRDLFEHLRADGIQTALASSAKGAELDHYKSVAQISDLTEEETSSEDAEKSKPHPDIFEAALSRLGDVRPDDVVIVGDTPYDAEAAGKAGIRAIGLLCGGWPEDTLRRAGCIAVYKDIADLLAHYNAFIHSNDRPAV